MLFIPQRPYMVLGSFRKKISYPHPEGEFSDGEILQVLTEVNLGDLAKRVGGLDTVLDWANDSPSGNNNASVLPACFSITRIMRCWMKPPVPWMWLLEILGGGQWSLASVP